MFFVSFRLIMYRINCKLLCVLLVRNCEKNIHFVPLSGQGVAVSVDNYRYARVVRLNSIFS